jgi:hypothetical protein
MSTTREKPMPAVIDSTRSGCAAGAFVNRSLSYRQAFDAATNHGSRLKAVFADSESRFLAIKKFFVLTGFASHRRSPKPVFRPNRRRLIRDGFSSRDAPEAYDERLVHARMRVQRGVCDMPT